MASKCTVVNPWHWLNEDGSSVDDPKLRSRSLRVAQCIEYGGLARRRDVLYAAALGRREV